MKRLIIALALVLLSTGVAKAGLYTSLHALSADKIQADAYYTLDTAGENVRVYEFTPKLSRDVRCIMTFTETNRGGAKQMQCFKKNGINNK